MLFFIFFLYAQVYIEMLLFLLSLSRSSRKRKLFSDVSQVASCTFTLPRQVSKAAKLDINPSKVTRLASCLSVSSFLSRSVRLRERKKEITLFPPLSREMFQQKTSYEGEEKDICERIGFIRKRKHFRWTSREIFVLLIIAFGGEKKKCWVLEKTSSCHFCVREKKIFSCD